ncbi:hypothetical protein [Olsenella massiliensis]|uniref:hypothetical protein n=1 Tax=Olsenella massiliensis TaxID=1622075 RepID=UPI00071D8718|nr:hypothetical protein [Olsenella massiliensis]
MSDVIEPRTVTTTSQDKSGTLDVAALVLVAILLAAGFVLNLTVGKALGATGIQPEFVIAAYCLAILIIRPTVGQTIVIALLAATVIQITTSAPGVEYLCDVPASLIILLASRLTGRGGAGKVVIPFVGSFLTTAVSGMIFAGVVTLVIRAVPVSFVAMMPIVFGTAVANAIIVALLYLPLKKAAKR